MFAFSDGRLQVRGIPTSLIYSEQWGLFHILTADHFVNEDSVFSSNEREKVCCEHAINYGKRGLED